MMTSKAILSSMRLDSIEEGTVIYIYRIYHGKFICEKGLANIKHRELQNYLCGRYDKEGNLSGSYKVYGMEGAVYSRGGNDTVWFLKPNKRKAKKVLRDLYVKRYEKYQSRANRISKIIKEELK